MQTLTDFALRDKYEKVRKLRSPLEDVKKLLDWNAFLSLFPDKLSIMGRPEYHKIFMVKILFLQNWFGISDEEVEYQIHNRLDFQAFLDFPTQVPDYSTVWRFRDDLTEGEILDKMWIELQRQIREKYIDIQKGVIQDARFIFADPGKKRSGMEGRVSGAKTSRSRDGTWTKKNNKSYFGFKLHTKVQQGSKLITGMAVTTASTHDSALDLANQDEIVYRDKAYTGVKTRARGNGSMKRGILDIYDLLRNKRIAKKRCRGEHPYGSMDRTLHAGKTKLTTLARVAVQQVFVVMAYNLHRLRFLLST